MGDLPVTKSETITRIIVIDDELDFSEPLIELLEEKGYFARSAKSGAEALEISKTEIFNVALIDIRLPDCDGSNLLKALKENNPEIIGIIVTGFPTIESAVESLNLGADGYIIKPFRIEKLLDTINEQIRKQKEEKIQEILTNLGFSKYESKIYLELISGEDTFIRKISMNSGVPRTKVYSAIEKLIQRGLVFEKPGKKQEYAVETPSIALKDLIEQKKQELSKQAGNIASLEHAVNLLDTFTKYRLDSSVVRREEFWSVQGQDAIDQIISDLLSKTEKTVRITISLELLGKFLRRYYRTLENLSEKVSVELYFPKNARSDQRSSINKLEDVFKVFRVDFSTNLLTISFDSDKFLMTNLYNEDFPIKLAFLFQSKENDLVRALFIR